MVHILFNKQIYHLLRMCLGGVFVLSGTIKAFDLYSFSKVIETFAILPDPLCPFAAIGICVFEIIFGLGLVWDIKASLAIILGMLMVFLAVIGHAIYMGYDIDCGCFGPNDPEAKLFASLKTALVRDIGMIFSVIYLYILRVKHDHTPRSLIQILKEKTKNEIN
ncbi:MAG: DoxX family protein [Pseudomonadota bacterium]